MIDRRWETVAGVEEMPLDAAHRRILAADIAAPIAVPAADNSAVDGYALRHADLGHGKETRLKLVGTSAAGHLFAGGLGKGEAVRIFTGAVIPEGADTIAMQEDARRDGEAVFLPSELRVGANIRRAGEDIAPGACVFGAGRALDAADIGILASLGIARVPVRKKLRVAVFSTGDELALPGAARRNGQIYDANRPMLIALLANLGVDATDLGILADNRKTVEAALRDASGKYDAVVGSAGMSVGDEDHVRPALEALGEIDFWKIAIKPGKPIGVGRVGKAAFFGLPGNPVALVVAFVTVVRPALMRLAGAVAKPVRGFPVVADFTMHRRTGRREFLRATLQEDAAGRLTARSYPRGGSGILSSITGSDGLLDIREDVADIAPGMSLSFIPFAALGL